MKYCIGLVIAFAVLSCQKSDLTYDEVLEGDYITNRLFDMSCVYLRDEQLPTLHIKKSSESTYTFTITYFVPKTTALAFKSVHVMPDGLGYQLLYQGQPVGSWKNIVGLGDQKLLSFTIMEPKTVTNFVGVKK